MTSTSTCLWNYETKTNDVYWILERARARVCLFVCVCVWSWVLMRYVAMCCFYSHQLHLTSFFTLSMVFAYILTFLPIASPESIEFTRNYWSGKIKRFEKMTAKKSENSTEMDGIQSNKIQFELLSFLIWSNFIFYSPHIFLSSFAFISDEILAKRIYNIPSIVLFFLHFTVERWRNPKKPLSTLRFSLVSTPHLVRLYYVFEWLFTLSITLSFNRSNKKNSLEILVWHNFSIHCHIATLHISFATLFIENRFSIIRFSRFFFHFYSSSIGCWVWLGIYVFAKDIQDGDDWREMRENCVNMKLLCDGCLEASV